MHGSHVAVIFVRATLLLRKSSPGKEIALESSRIIAEEKKQLVLKANGSSVSDDHFDFIQTRTLVACRCLIICVISCIFVFLLNT